MKEYMTSFGIPIVCRVEGGGTIQDVQKSLAQKLNNLNLRDFPSLEQQIEQELAAKRTKDNVMKAEALGKMENDV